MSPDVELAGYAELRGAGFLGVDGAPWSVQERLRPVFEAAVAERVNVEAVVEARWAQGRHNPSVINELLADSSLGPDLKGAGCDLSAPARYEEVSDYLSVERLRLDVNLPAVDLKIGRQAITWGSALVVHPTDPFPEVLALDPGKERAGVQAVRAEVPVGAHQVSALVAVGDDLSTFHADDTKFEDLPFTGAGRFTVRALEADWSAVAWGRPDGVWFGGADLRGTLGVGWWVEGGWHGAEEAPEVVVGIDYSFPVAEQLYVAAEYRYDGTGAEPEAYDWAARGGGITVPSSCAVFSAPATAEETNSAPRFTLGQHYAHGILNVRLTEELAVSTAAVVNLKDTTGILVPDVSYNLGTNAVIHLGAQVPFGEDGEFRPDPSELTASFGGLPPDKAVALADVIDGMLFDASINAWLRYSF